MPQYLLLTRRLGQVALSGVLALWLSTTTLVRAQNSPVITSFQTVGGAYQDLTVASGGYALMTANTGALGTIRVMDGGTLHTNGYLVGGGNFELQAGGTLVVTASDGIAASGGLGSVRNITRQFSPDANYEYRAVLTMISGPGAQFTGSGLPSRVRSLTADVQNLQGPPQNNALVLSNGVSVAQRLVILGSTLVRTDFLASGSLTLLSDPIAGTALLDDRSTAPAPLIGPLVIQRSINPGLNPGAGYRHLSAPVQGATVASLTTAGFTPVVNPAYNSTAVPGSVTPFPTVFGYVQARLASSPATGLSSFDKGWESPVTLSSPLEIGRGYTVNLPASSVLSFRGTPNLGDVALALARGTDAESGWQLLGNPFPSPLDWRQVTIPTGLDGAVCVYQSTGQYTGRYRSYINGVGNPVLPLGQAFFVRVSQPGSVVNLTLPRSARLTQFGQEAPLQRGVETRPLVQLTLGAAGSAADETYVYFEAGATAGVDAGYDALKLQPGAAGMPALWSLAAGAEQAINGLPALTSRTVVPLGLLLPQAGSYSLEAAQLLNLAAARVYLHDAQTGQLIDLRRQPRYAFTAGTAGRLTSRFELRFEPLRPTASAAALSAASVSVYPNPAREQFAVRVPAVPGARQLQATLLNALGQTVQRQTAELPSAGRQLSFDVRGLKAGVYTLRLQAGAETLTKRVVIN
ncbi:T9SS type A sorting domain-containing protein [Hymenobacter gummosus]|uniref:T9SS type A sorting domain-containing protein n=1 Tax=Hymenobacter gummosus TaxID=1776032 RepID=A0A431U883_9BACT|nr:T9SS type A sorting domain-containing protein [Hymenobacter gummosus]RTQ53453.1 T9SS type A sorting domain-containing protein [Hymenobacter gummosus]